MRRGNYTLGGPKSGHELTLGLDGFNLLNRVNYASYVGIISSPLFGRPVSARSARQFQFSISCTEFSLDVVAT